MIMAMQKSLGEQHSAVWPEMELLCCTSASDQHPVNSIFNSDSMFQTATASTIRPPENTLIETSATGPVWLEEGIVMTVNTGRNTTTIEAAKDSVRVVTRITGTRRRPLLVDITQVHRISREVREYYARDVDSTSISALALVTRSRLSNMVANFFLGINTLSVPTRLFACPVEAKSWLKTYLNNADV